VLPAANPISDWIEHAALRGNKRLHQSELYVEPVLRFEVFDHNTLFRDVFVGQVALSPRQIVEVLADGESEVRVYPLQPRTSSGMMCLTIAQTTHFETGIPYIVVKVDGCRKLISASAPCTVAFWDGRPLGTSPVLPPNSNPTWTNCIFNFPLNDVTSSSTERRNIHDISKALGTKLLLIQVWDHGGVGERNLLGEVELSGEVINQLVRRSNRVAVKAGPRLSILTSVAPPPAKRSSSVVAAGGWIAGKFVCGCHRMWFARCQTSASSMPRAAMRSVSVTREERERE